MPLLPAPLCFSPAAATTAAAVASSASSQPCCPRQGIVSAPLPPPAMASFHPICCRCSLPRPQSVEGSGCRELLGLTRANNWMSARLRVRPLDQKLEDRHVHRGGTTLQTGWAGKPGHLNGRHGQGRPGPMQQPVRSGHRGGRGAAPPIRRASGDSPSPSAGSDRHSMGLGTDNACARLWAGHSTGKGELDAP